MSRIITLTLPDEIWQRFEHKATADERPVEDIIVETLKANPPAVTNYDDILQPLTQYTDEQLWTVVEQGLSPARQTRLRQLNDKIESADTLTPDEEAELKRLIHELDIQILLRSHALVLLKERGQDIEVYLRHAVGQVAIGFNRCLRFKKPLKRLKSDVRTALAVYRLLP